MLRDLLIRLSGSNGMTSTQSLARDMGVSPAFVKQMIDHAVVLGYLAVTDPGCGKEACPGCNLRQVCSSSGTAQLWAITEKGQSVIGDKSQTVAPKRLFAS